MSECKQKCIDEENLIILKTRDSSLEDSATNLMYLVQNLV
jgi:hypothetical protein